MRFRLTLILVLAAGLFLAACWSGGQGKDLRLINEARASYGRSTLSPHQAAMDKAQGWANHMAATGRLEHTGGGSTVDPRPLTGWCSYGENVGMGSSVDAVHHLFLQSSAHRANMLGRFNAVGTGVLRKGDRVWVTEIYLRTC